jgi:hypothetical protein
LFYFISGHNSTKAESRDTFGVAHTWRNSIPGITLMVHIGTGKLDKETYKTANASDETLYIADTFM